MNIPGVYASVEKNLCFVKWAIQCKHGGKYDDFINVGDCSNYMANELSLLDEQKLYYEEIISNLQGQQGRTFEMSGIHIYIIMFMFRCQPI